MIQFADTKAGAERPTSQDNDRLADEIAELAAHLHAATYRLLVLLREYDRRECWGWGFKSCAHWLSWRTGIAPGAAREKVRVARALGGLPLISAAMESGELSYSKVRALTRVATPANEATLLEFARGGTASHVERLVRAWRKVDRIEEAEREQARHESRRLTLYPDDDGSWVLRGRLDPEVGAVLEKALEAAREELYGRRSPSDSSPTQRRADAIGLVAEWALEAGADVPAETSTAERALGEGAEVPAETSAADEASAAAPSPPRRPPSRADRYQVVVHVDAETLEEDSETGQSALAGGGQRVPAGTSRRIACDASVVEMRHDSAGRVLDVGRRRRTIPTAIRRALEHRDRVCRFPGCESRYCDVHHVVHWADGGATKLENLMLLCRTHHRAVHEGGYRVEVGQGADGRGDDGQGDTRPVRFLNPFGVPLPKVPPAPAMVGDLVTQGDDPDIGPWTPTPDWHGEKLDVDYAIYVLRDG